MFQFASRIALVATIIRIAAAVVIVGAIAYGIYLASKGLISSGLLWIVSAVVFGWIGNMILGLLLALTSSGADTPSQGLNQAKVNLSANGRYRGLHTSLGSRKSR